MHRHPKFAEAGHHPDARCKLGKNQCGAIIRGSQLGWDHTGEDAVCQMRSFDPFIVTRTEFQSIQRIGFHGRRCAGNERVVTWEQ